MQLEPPEPPASADDPAGTAAPLSPVPDLVAAAVAAIDAGRLVALPTETVYGLAADAADDDALLAVYAAKGRPLGHPLIVHIAGAEELDAWSDDVPDAARRLAATFWPGPLTIVLRRAAHVSRVVTGGHDTVALRVPDHELTRAVLGALGTGRGLAAPSANRFGRVSPTTAEHVAREFALGEVLVVDGGPCAVGIESTIVDLTSEPAMILRPGAISAEQVAAVAGHPVVPAPAASAAPDAGAASAAASRTAAPGTLAAHYAPLARVTLVAAGADAAAIVADAAAEPPMVAWARPGSSLAAEARRAGATVLDMPSEPAGVARDLYAVLHGADATGARHVLVELPEGGDIAAAVRDRLARAATGSALGADRAGR